MKSLHLTFTSALLSCAISCAMMALSGAPYPAFAQEHGDDLALSSSNYSQTTAHLGERAFDVQQPVS